MSTYPKTTFIEGSAPGITAAELNKIGDGVEAAHSELASHEADYVYQTAGGTGTAITLTISETLVNGLPITFIASANNSGAATTVNGKPLYKPNTTAAPTLIAGKAYTVWYNLAGNCFFIKASATGTATPAQVLAEVPYSNENDTDLIGTIPILSGDSAALALSIDGTTLKLRPPKGYKDGVDDTVSYTDANRLVGNIKYGTVLDGLTGTHNQVELLVAGDLQYAYSAGNSSSTTTMTKKLSTTVYKSGTARVSFRLYPINGQSVSAQIYVNSVARGTLRTVFGSTTFTEDITVNANDIIQLYIASSVSGEVAALADVWLGLEQDKVADTAWVF